MSEDWVDESGNKDYADKRTFTLPDGKVIHIEKVKGPFGFWSIHYDHGEVPDVLKGRFTSPQEAQNQVMAHVHALEAAAIKRRGEICPPLTEEERKIKPMKNKETTIFSAG
jgi:hypothetical protein